MSHRLATALTLSSLAGVLAVTQADADALPRLDLPVDCEIGQTCMIQFYVDHDPSPVARDYRCGTLTYDGHEGTDIRLPDLVTMRRGIPVVAAADGVVLRTRNGEPDISVTDRGEEALRGAFAGNAVVIAHGDGWETQYSHLMAGSVAVEPGQQVRAGDRLGLIGLSGRTNFPHVEFVVRHGQTIVDPFVGPTDALARCDGPTAPLWSRDALEALGYRSSGVLLAGFADHPPDRAATRDGANRATDLDAQSPALVFWTDVYGLRAGDRASFRVRDPAGEVIVSFERVIDTDGPQRFDFAGRKRPREGWQPGLYQGHYMLRRAVAGISTVVAEVSRTVTLR